VAGRGASPDSFGSLSSIGSVMYRPTVVDFQTLGFKWRPIRTLSPTVTG
jgi:hypothetical protein